MKKHITLVLIFSVAFVVLPSNSRAQLLNKLGQKAKQKFEKTAEKQVDKSLNGSKDKQDQTTQTSERSSSDDQGEETSAAQNAGEKEDYVSSYKSKFDFVPGEKVIVMDDFVEDDIGDFPGSWFTNGSGEVVTLDDKEGKWLMLKGRSQAYIDQLLNLPENFTIQFDLLCSVPFSWHSDVFNLYIEDIKDLDRYRKGDNGGEISDNNINHHFWLDLHPGVYNPTSYNTKGYGHYKLARNGAKIELNEIWMPGAEKNLLKVSIWRQGQRLRVYLNENKMLDLPKFLPADMKPNLVVFEPYDLVEDNNYFIGNLRIAVGNPDTRNKLLTEGKLVTNGILFNVNSDRIKTESYGVLKEIASILKENEKVNIKIIGHTDSDGNDATNLELSKRRAESVKDALVKDFSIDAQRLTTDGKGETEPVAQNTSANDRANNRRVEFVKVN